MRLVQSVDFLVVDDLRHAQATGKKTVVVAVNVFAYKIIDIRIGPPTRGAHLPWSQANIPPLQGIRAKQNDMH